MTATRFMLLMALVWVIIALVVALLMRRRGYDFYSWLVLSSVLGPLVVPLAVQRNRHHGKLRHASSEIAGPMNGAFDVLFWYRGGAEEVQALQTALTLFGDRVTSVTLAAVLDYDCETSWAGRAMQSEARDALEGIASAVPWESPNTALLFGRADRAVAEHAMRAGIDMIVVGASKFGGDAAGRLELLTHCLAVPVFIGPNDLRSHGCGRDQADGSTPAHA